MSNLSTSMSLCLGIAGRFVRHISWIALAVARASGDVGGWGLWASSLPRALLIIDL